VLLPGLVEFGEGGEPLDGEPPEHCLDAFPPGGSLPLRLLLLERLYSRLVVPDGRHLRAEHDGREQSEQQGLEHEEQQEYDGGWRREDCAALPVAVDAGDEVVDREKEGVEGDDADVEGEEDEELLVLLTHAVVDPGAVVVHLLDTSLTN